MSYKIKNILIILGVVIVISALFIFPLIITTTPITKAKEVCVLNHNGDTLYFDNSGNVKYNRYSDQIILIEDNSNKYKFINGVIKITSK
jgi:hypothetical protein